MLKKIQENRMRKFGREKWVTEGDSRERGDNS
jgi:hypothetical protein